MSFNLQTIKDIRTFLAKELESLYDRREINSLANSIIKTVIGASGLHDLHNSGRRVSTEQASEILRFSEELKTGKPWQYILGETTFFDCIIKVNPSVLIPRQETEELADLIIRENNDYQGHIIDFGTGSGCIAIALAANLQGATVTGIDISEKAISLAKENSALNNVFVRFETGDIFNFTNKSIRAGIIVSNPPYVRNSEKKLMHRNVLEFEPAIALFVDNSDPLIYYKAIINIAENVLADGGLLYFEINEAFGDQIYELMVSSRYSGIKLIKDINNKPRIIKGLKNA